MINRIISQEIVYLNKNTPKNKFELEKYYNTCYKKIPLQDYTTQFEHNLTESAINNVILAFIRDYALFDEDNSELLKKYKPEEDNDDVSKYFHS